MLSIGKICVGRFEILIMPIDPFLVGTHQNMWLLNESFYDVTVTENLEVPYYVHLNKDPRFDFIDFKKPPKKPADDKDEAQMKMYEDLLKEYHSYIQRNSMQMPAFLLTSDRAKMVIDRCSLLAANI